MRRQDQSQLTGPGSWNAVCAEAATLAPDYAPGFFFYRFDWLKVGDGRAFATGYYEPEIEGSRLPLPGYVPIYRVPNDLQRDFGGQSFSGVTGGREPTAIQAPAQAAPSGAGTAPAPGFKM